MVRETVTILKGEEVHRKLIEGSRKTADAVSTTYGPFGQNVALTRLWNKPHITKDGSTVADDIILKDPVENVAADTIKTAAKTTSNLAGDGTTSTTILANELVKLADEFRQANPRLGNKLRNELKEAATIAVKAVEERSVEVGQAIKQIALVASNHDDEMATLVADAYSVIGPLGVVSVYESKSYSTYVDSTTGIKIDRSHIAPGLRGEGKTARQDVKILVTDLNIKTQQDALHLIQLQEKAQQPLLVICNDLENSALEVIAYSKNKFNLPLDIIRAPFMAEALTEGCKDLALATGATFIDKAQGWDILSVGYSVLGSADKVEITNKETNILGRHGNKEAIDKKVAEYLHKIENDIDGLAPNYRKRLAILNAGAAVIYVGGTNEIEVAEKKDRFDDTIKAVKAALEQGIVTGGGFTYRFIIDKLPNTDGGALLTKALPCLTNTILMNGKLEPTDANIEMFYKEVLKNQILDPTLVVTNTITNAVGAAVMIFTTDCVVIKDEVHGN